MAVTALVVTGTYRAWIEIRSLEGLTGETYGLVLLLKLAAFLPLIALGAINNRWAKPRIDRAAAVDTPDAAPLSTLRRLVTVEVLIGTIVLAITAVLVNVPPARVMAGAADGAGQQVMLGEQEFTLSVSPNQVGENTVEFLAPGMGDMGDEMAADHGAGADAGDGAGSGHAGAEGGDLEGVLIEFSIPSQNIGPLVAEAEEAGPGHWVVSGRQLSVPGTWTLEVVARVGRFGEERASVELTVPR